MRFSLLPLALVVSATPVLAQTPALEHRPVSCLVAGKYPRLTACIDEPDAVTRARVFFRAEGTSAWYHVLMERDAACFAGVLPRPKKELVGRHVDYYVEADHRRLGAPRTAESHPLVVGSAGECQSPLVAAIAASGPTAVLPVLPSGFAAGGLGAGTVAAIVGGGLAAGGAAVAVGGGDGGSAAPEPPAPVTTAPAPVSTTPSAPAPDAPDQTLAVTCEARPNSGPVPLTVRFQAMANGPSPIALRWDFGDGESSDAATVEHVYRTAGRFQATARASSGGQTERCTRTIAVDVPPLQRFALDVVLASSGQGGVSSSPGGIDCAPTCSAGFDEGTAVRLTATAATSSTFRGWGGACGGNGACTVTMTSAVAVTATFDPAVVPKQTLTVQVGGSGTGAVTSNPAGINCPADCDEAYATGTVVALSAQPQNGSTFAGWGGACSGTGGCSVTLNAAQTVTARFDPPAPVTFQLEANVQGPGMVFGGGINCPGVCIVMVAQGTVVTLRAQSSLPGGLVAWSGDCSGSAATCTVTMDHDRRVFATFAGAAPNRAPVPHDVAWTSRLEGTRVTGSIRAGNDARDVGPGTVLVTWSVAEGEVRVELELRGAAGSTAVWRLQPADARVEPGTLHVLSGDVVDLGPAAVAFRLRAGERAAFAFSTR